MRMLPPYIGPEIKSNGEHRLFDLLKNLDYPDNVVCFHSLNLPEHLYKAAGELDFVIILPGGVFILEVKGGGVTFRDGIWHHQNRWGRVDRNSEGPFRQASSGMYSLIERLGREFSITDYHDIVFGYGVVFPDCRFDVESIEWDPRIVFDNGNFTPGALKSFLESISRYWHSKFPNRPDTMSTDAMRQLRHALRPDFEMVPTLESHAGYIEAQLERLTQEQYDRLDAVEHCDRLLVEGGAGTGKTFLAAEIARRHLHAGQKVLLICFSPLLASHLRHRLRDLNIHVYPIHQFMIEFVNRYSRVPDGFVPGLPITSPWFRNVLAPEFATVIRQITDDEKFDVLIVDEGQDIINLDYTSVLDAILRGGLSSGVWRIFFDSNSQSGIYGMLDEEVLDMLRSFGPVPPRLIKNCRNTSQIILQTSLLTGADLNTEGAGPGPDVSISYFKDSDNAAEHLERILKDLKNISSGDITILSPLSWQDSSVRRIRQPMLSRIKVLRGSIQDTFPDSRTTFAQIQDFKGLENRYIILTDVSDLDSNPVMVSNLYVGMTRARVKLWMLVDEGLKDRQQEITIQNIKRMTERVKND